MGKKAAKSKKDKKYNVDDAWPIDEPTNVDDCLKRLIKLSNNEKRLECHGASKLKHEGISSIRSKFDIRFHQEKNKDHKEVEKHLLKSFVQKAKPHFPPEANRFIDIAHLKWDRLYNTGTLFIGRHYRLPTRCVDWTRNPFIALFFACSNWKDINKTGVVWWMNYNAFSNAIKKQWQPAYGKDKNIEEDFEKDFTESKDRDILIRFHYKCLLDRPIKQNAHIILYGDYNMHHDKKIYDLLNPKIETKTKETMRWGRIVIQPSMKFNLLEKLNLLGINKITLGIEDTYIDTIASQVADDILGPEKSSK